jgi:predicted metal-dependent peptidase
MTGSHSQRATVALQKLAEEDPAFMSLSLWCHHRDVDMTLRLTNIKTGETKDVDATPARAYTDGKTIYYAPKFAEWTLQEQVAVCAHEIMHIAFRHINRAKKLRERFGGAYNNKVFNIATDAIINQTLELAGYKLPRPCVMLTEVLDEVFGEKVSPTDAVGEWDAEKLYIRIMNAIPPMPPQGGGSGEETEAGDGDDGDGKSAAEKLEDYADSKGFGDDMDTEGKSTPEDSQEDSEWQQRLARAMEMGRQAGRGVGKLGHKIADIPKSRTPWELILRRLVSRAVTRTPRPSFMRPTKTWLAQETEARRTGSPVPPYEKGMVKMNDQPRIVIGVDVSGSISDPLLRKFTGEIASIGKKTGSEIHVLVFDTEVLSETKVAGIDLDAEIKKIEFARGGGTCFVEVMERAQAIDPSIIVMLTDLYGPFGPAPKGVQTIWASPLDNPPTPPFGRLISLAA